MNNFEDSVRKWVRLDDEVRKRYANEWYEKSLNDYHEVINLAPKNNPKLFIEGKLGISYLISTKALWSDKNTAEKLFKLSKEEIQKILNQYPNNQRALKYDKLVDAYISISKEDLGIKVEIIE